MSAADVVVVGAGVVGAATARALAARGASVALLERGSLRSAEGSSRGAGRIVAPAAYPDASYLEGGLRALEGWRALEAASGTSLLELSGALYAGAAVEGFATAFEAAGVRFERLSASVVARRFGIAGIEAEPILLQPDAGVIRADRARAALLRGAAALGARLHGREGVVGVDVRGEAVEVTTTRRRWLCRQVVVTAGPWTGDLLRAAGVDVALPVSSQTVAYFRLPPGTAALPALMEFDGDEPYALVDPLRGLKAALHRRGPEVAPDAPWLPVEGDALDRIGAWARSRFPGLDERPWAVEACLYTNAPGERFVLERRGPIVVGSACSGQGFQHAPHTAEVLAELAWEPLGIR
jgi:sarcosine oxidase